jgi:hypothetical protein
VLVHGAWVDGSGWKPIYEILVREGLHLGRPTRMSARFEASLRFDETPQECRRTICRRAITISTTMRITIIASSRVARSTSKMSVRA